MSPPAANDHERLEATIEDLQRFAQEVLFAVR
jgi:hypothetical protein